MKCAMGCERWDRVSKVRAGLRPDLADMARKPDWRALTDA
jgi:hypothetical protein